MNLKTKQIGVNTNRTSFLSWNCTDITARSNKREEMMLDDMNNTNTTENCGGGGILVLRNESSFCSTDDARHATIEYCCNLVISHEWGKDRTVITKTIYANMSIIHLMVSKSCLVDNGLVRHIHWCLKFSCSYNEYSCNTHTINQSYMIYQYSTFRCIKYQFLSRSTTETYNIP